MQSISRARNSQLVPVSLEIDAVCWSRAEQSSGLRAAVLASKQPAAAAMLLEALQIIAAVCAPRAAQ